MTDYDVIIVGARCAGCATGIHLARAGVKVLAIDSAELPSDMIMSTHYVHPLGVDAMDRLGVGGHVREAAPATTRIRYSVDDVSFVTPLPEGRAGRCIRRSRLDPLLQNAAASAGVELRDRCKLVEVIRKGERVTGVVVDSSAGRETLSAKWVIGADGRRSTFARLVQAEEYHGFDTTRNFYWSYWPAPAAWNEGSFASHDAHLFHEGANQGTLFHVDGDLLLIGMATPSHGTTGWGKEYRERYHALLRASPHTADLVMGNKPATKIRGLVQDRFYFRKPIGPGYALVGDAGAYKDFTTGHGITDALLCAETLAAAVLDGSHEALEWYWRNRDANTLGLHFDAQRAGEVGFNNPFNRLAVKKMGEDEQLAAQVSKIFERKLEPIDLVTAWRVLGWLGLELLRGNTSILAPFLRHARRVGLERAEMKAAEQRLAALVRNWTPPQLEAEMTNPRGQLPPAVRLRSEGRGAGNRRGSVIDSATSPTPSSIVEEPAWSSHD